MWDDDEIIFGSTQHTASMDAVLETKISDLTDRKRAQSKPLSEGTRVVAHTNNGVVIPGQLPKAGTKGTVVAVKTANGDVTSLDGEVFVRFDGRDKIDRIDRTFLRVASMKVSSLEDHFIVLSGPSLMASFADPSGENTLVHKSSQDLWSVKLSEDGSYDVERLFDDNGNPLKV